MRSLVSLVGVAAMLLAACSSSSTNDDAASQEPAPAPSQSRAQLIHTDELGPSCEPTTFRCPKGMGCFGFAWFGIDGFWCVPAGVTVCECPNGGSCRGDLMIPEQLSCR